MLLWCIIFTLFSTKNLEMIKNLKNFKMLISTTKSIWDGFIRFSTIKHILSQILDFLILNPYFLLNFDPLSEWRSCKPSLILLDLTLVVPYQILGVGNYPNWESFYTFLIASRLRKVRIWKMDYRNSRCQSGKADLKKTLSMLLDKFY